MDYKAIKRTLLIFSTVAYLFGCFTLIIAVVMIERQMMDRFFLFIIIDLLISCDAHRIAIKNYIQYGKIRGIDFFVEQQLNEHEEEITE